jgi:hypothetical protein
MSLTEAYFSCDGEETVHKGKNTRQLSTRSCVAANTIICNTCSRSIGDSNSASHPILPISLRMPDPEVVRLAASQVARCSHLSSLPEKWKAPLIITTDARNNSKVRGVGISRQRQVAPVVASQVEGVRSIVWRYEEARQAFGVPVVDLHGPIGFANCARCHDTTCVGRGEDSLGEKAAL